MLVNHASAGYWEGLTECSVGEFEQAWRVNGRGAFVASKEAAATTLATPGPAGVERRYRSANPAPHATH